MLMGIKLQAHPTADQKLVLSQWMGCARFIWNAKCREDSYRTVYARKYLPVNTYPEPDQTYSMLPNVKKEEIGRNAIISEALPL